jgi:hypothetical protein
VRNLLKNDLAQNYNDDGDGYDQDDQYDEMFPSISIDTTNTCSSVYYSQELLYAAISIHEYVFLRSVRRLLVTASVVPSSLILVTVMKEALSSSGT